MQDFPFDSESDLANWLAFQMTPVLRPAIRGSVPLAEFDAPAQSNGKTLLVKLAGLQAMGRWPSLRAIPKDEEEWRKTLPSALLESPVMVVFENLNWKLRSSALTRYLTAGESAVSDRALGSTAEVVVPVRTTWALTGNNAELDRELLTRSYRIRLNAQMPYPERRKPEDFAEPDIERWTLEHRSELLAANLTLARAWFAAGCPKGDHPHMARFDEWCHIVGGILCNAGVTGFLSNLHDMYESADPESSEWAAFLRAWCRIIGDGRSQRAGDVYEKLDANEKFKATLPIELADAFEKGRTSFVRSLGWKLKDRVDRVYSLEDTNYTVRMGRDSKTGKQAWSVRTVAPL